MADEKQITEKETTKPKKATKPKDTNKGPKVVN